MDQQTTARLLGEAEARLETTASMAVKLRACGLSAMAAVAAAAELALLLRAERVELAEATGPVEVGVGRVKRLVEQEEPALLD